MFVVRNRNVVRFPRGLASAFGCDMPRSQPPVNKLHGFVRRRNVLSLLQTLLWRRLQLIIQQNTQCVLLCGAPKGTALSVASRLSVRPVKVTENENAKLFFVHIFVKNGSIYVRPKRSAAHSTHKYLQIHFANGNASFLW